MNLAQAAIRFDIDPLQLDKEWLSHSQMVYNAGARVAEAQSELDNAELDVKVKKATLGVDFRADPAGNGLTKTTDKAIEDAVDAEPTYIAAQRRVIQAYRALNDAKAAANALEHRKRALTLLVELWEREYFSDPTPRRRYQPSTEDDIADIRSRGRRFLSGQNQEVKEESRLEDDD